MPSLQALQAAASQRSAPSACPILLSIIGAAGLSLAIFVLTMAAYNLTHMRTLEEEKR